MCYKIIHILLRSSKRVRGLHLSDKCHVGESTVSHAIKRINYLLLEKKLPPLISMSTKVKSDGYLLEQNYII